MASTWNSLKRTIGIAIPTSMAVLAIGGGTAKAQTTYILEGSDTLTEVIQNAIIGSGAHLSYNNIGSGQAEKNMLGAGGTGHPTQGIGPMSRNFGATVLNAHPTWAPKTANVVALDAPVVSVRNLLGNQCLDVSPGNVSGNQGLAPLNSNLSIVLSGYPSGGLGVKSKGTTAECADPRRLAAVQALATCQGVDSIQHIYRRDDKSGTQDTWRERLQFDYWCNGKAEGNNGAVGSNLLNDDNDPIRRPCVGADSTKTQSRCTFYPTNQTCGRSGDPATITDPTYGTLSCTQGLIVAISENDPGSKDITVSIGHRVGLDITNRTIGLAGLASANLPDNSSIGTTINTNTYEPNNIHNGAYMFSRRLFLQKNPAGSGDSGRDAEENALFSWVTTNCGIQAIVTEAGFLLPQDGVCGNVSCTDLFNISCTTPDAGLSAAKQNLAYGETCNSAYPCGTTGTACATGTCPAAAKLASTYACNASAECSATCNTAAGTCN